MSLWKWLKDRISQVVVGIVVGVVVGVVLWWLPLIGVSGSIVALALLYAAIATFYLVAQRKDRRKGKMEPQRAI